MYGDDETVYVVEWRSDGQWKPLLTVHDGPTVAAIVLEAVREHALDLPENFRLAVRVTTTDVIKR